MKALKNIITLAALIALPLTAMTAEPEKQPDAKIHKVVFEVAIDGAEQWLGALRNVENVQKAGIEYRSHSFGIIANQIGKLGDAIGLNAFKYEGHRVLGTGFRLRMTPFEPPERDADHDCRRGDPNPRGGARNLRQGDFAPVAHGFENRL